MSNAPPKAIKCLTLALDSASHEGEWHAAAIRFCAILRKDGIGIDALFPEDPKPNHRQKVDVMPFGKFKGTSICDLPDWYLEWCSVQDFVKSPLRDSIETEIAERLHQKA